MPVLKHAKKKMRQDKKRTLRNKRVKAVFRDLMKKAKQQPTQETVGAAFSSLDKAAKKHILHKNKVARMKSSLSKLLPKEAGEKKPAAVKKETPKKKTVKAPAKKVAKKKTAAA